jgi:O-antigen biosynthesis protein WbqP
MLNRFISLLLLVLLLPLFLIIAIFIIINDNWPVYYKQYRIGLHSSVFAIYKFRTMRKNTPELATHLLQNPNSYILSTGKLLRKFSLDELPNLFNILKGDMVFVGPRPALHNQYDLIEMRKKDGIDKVKPGITGWAQVNGRDELTIEEKIKFDKEYIERKSFFFDLKILFLTIYNVLLRNGIKH